MVNDASEHERAIERATAAAEKASAIGARALFANAVLEQAIALHGLGDIGRPAELLDRAAALSLADGDQRRSAEAYRMIGLLRWRSKDTRGARETFEKAATQLRGDPASEAGTLRRISEMLLVTEGDLEGVEAVHDRISALFATGDGLDEKAVRTQVAQSLRILALALQQRGRLGEARSRLDEGRAHVSDGGIHRDDATLMSETARLMIKQGNLAEALRWSNHAIAELRNSPRQTDRRADYPRYRATCPRRSRGSCQRARRSRRHPTARQTLAAQERLRRGSDTSSRSGRRPRGAPALSGPTGRRGAACPAVPRGVPIRGQRRCTGRRSPRAGSSADRRGRARSRSDVARPGVGHADRERGPRPRSFPGGDRRTTADRRIGACRSPQHPAQSGRRSQRSDSSGLRVARDGTGSCDRRNRGHRGREAGREKPARRTRTSGVVSWSRPDEAEEPRACQSLGTMKSMPHESLLLTSQRRFSAVRRSTLSVARQLRRPM
jgi:tetratricopeptide (TPR) repeat protein